MKLKENISFKELEKYGFVEDPSNCEPGEPYYGDNNYYYEFTNCYNAEFRLVCNMHTREFEILAMAKETGLLQLYNKFNVFINLIKNGLVE